MERKVVRKFPLKGCVEALIIYCLRIALKDAFVIVMKSCDNKIDLGCVKGYDGTLINLF